MTSPITPRETAIKILYEIDVQGAYSNIALKKFLKETDYRVVDRGFITELVYGIIKNKTRLDYIISKFSSTKINKMSPWILNILRLGVYQILFLERVPDSAACNESVNLSKKYGHTASTKFVNAVLRNVARQKETIEYPDKKRNPIDYLEVTYSHPRWMIGKWIKNYGFEFAEGLCKANNQVADLTARANTLKTTPEELASHLTLEGLQVEQGKYIDEALILSRVGNIEGLEASKRGLFQVQDESSMLVSKVLDPQPGETIIDVCCAPGGKTTHIAQLMKNTGKIYGWDIHPHKIELVRTAAQRLGIDILELEARDATVENTDLFNKADRVLVDAPCTGIGIIRRKPDIKWNKASEDLKGITQIQRKILDTASKYVKSGGTLVYSTCTIQDEENINLVKAFLAENPEFELDSIEALVPQGLRKETVSKGYLQLYPNIDDTDGFFICRLKLNV